MEHDNSHHSQKQKRKKGENFIQHYAALVRTLPFSAQKYNVLSSLLKMKSEK
jgi:hypothetical protein